MEAEWRESLARWIRAANFLLPSSCRVEERKEEEKKRFSSRQFCSWTPESISSFLLFCFRFTLRYFCLGSFLPLPFFYLLKPHNSISQCLGLLPLISSSVPQMSGIQTVQRKQGGAPVTLKSPSLLETHMQTDKPPVHRTVEGSLLETAVRNVSRSETKRREQ